MDVSTATSLISSVGFPIVACVYMFYLNQNMTEKHKVEMDGMKDAINANTNVIAKLETLLETFITKGEKENDNAD